jgi:valyl-tRNA synthetase
MVANTTLLVPMAGLIDAAAEIDRLTKVIGKNETDIGKLRAKLANERFVKNAKPEMVEADRTRLSELEAQNTGLARQLERVRRLGGN